MSNDFGEFLEQENKVVESISGLMQKVFVWMFVGVGLTAIIAFIVASSEALIALIFDNPITLILLIVAEFSLVLILSSSIQKMSYVTAIIGFIAYSIINGLTLSSIFIIYELPSISTVFFITAGMFGLMALIGYNTNIDISRIGNILFIGLVTLIIGSIINLFIYNDGLNLLISIIGIIVFVGLTAYDTQKVKKLAETASSEQINNLSIICALTLYLDFINIFLRLIRIFGKRK